MSEHELAADKFVEQFECIGPIRLVARQLYRELHPRGMQTNGPIRLELDASTVRYLLERWKIKSESVNILTDAADLAK